jgi:hypothetical protein
MEGNISTGSQKGALPVQKSCEEDIHIAPVVRNMVKHENCICTLCRRLNDGLNDQKLDLLQKRLI